MRPSAALLSGFLLAGFTWAQGLSSVNERANLLRRGSPGFAEHLRRDALNVVKGVERRQEPAPPVPTSTPASGNAQNIDLAAWAAMTEAACMRSLMTLNGVATNPSGMAVCYNLPFLDKITGVFQAEMRVYNISPPTAEFVGVTARDLSITLSYLGATVQKTNGTIAMKKRSLVQPELLTRQLTMPVELRILSYVGQINDNIRGNTGGLDTPALQSLLVPQIQLSARNPLNGQFVQATLASMDASFVMGVFAGAGTQTINPDTQASATAVALTALPFQVPGLSLGIFPTGMIITLIWTILFVATVGFGTVRRSQYRDQYRRKVLRQGETATRRI